MSEVRIIAMTGGATGGRATEIPQVGGGLDAVTHADGGDEAEFDRGEDSAGHGSIGGYR